MRVCVAFPYGLGGDWAQKGNVHWILYCGINIKCTGLLSENGIEATKSLKTFPICKRNPTLRNQDRLYMFFEVLSELFNSALLGIVGNQVSCNLSFSVPSAWSIALKPFHLSVFKNLLNCRNINRPKLVRSFTANLLGTEVVWSFEFLMSKLWTQLDNSAHFWQDNMGVNRMGFGFWPIYWIFGLLSLSPSFDLDSCRQSYCIPDWM